MSIMPTRTPELQELLIKAADGLLSDDERQRLERLCAADVTLAAEIDELAAVRRALVLYGLRDANPGDWQRFEVDLAPSRARWIGWMLVFAGTLLLGGGGLWLFFAAPDVSVWAKLGSGLLLIGFALLFGYVGAGFVREQRNDPYRDVVR